MNGRQTQGLGMMITALGLLVLPGILVNNLQANALVNNQACNSSIDCSNIMSCTPSGGGTCILKATTGCQLNPNYCSLNNNISFLNPCSAWTGLLTLNFVGFVQSFFSNCGTAGAGSTQSESVGVANGTALLTDNIVCSGNVFPWNGQQGCQGWLQTWPGNNTSVQVTCQSTASILGVVLGVPNSSGNWCLVHPSTSLFDECGFNGVTPGAPFYCVKGFDITLQGLVTSTAVVIPSGAIGYIFNGTTAGSCAINLIVCQVKQVSGAVSVNAIFTFFLSLLGGTLLLLLALGINIGVGGSIFATGGTTSVGSNPQGTKIAQTFGIGLLIFMPLYSEFDTWFTSGYLPAGLDGNLFNLGVGQIGIISIALIVMFFLGLYFISQSGTPSST